MSASNIHGSWGCQLLAEQKVILQKGKGSWNVNAAYGYAKDLLKCANSLSDKPWASIGYGVDWELGVPEIENVVIELFHQVARLNCIIHVVVVKNSVAKFQLQKILKVDVEKYQLVFTSSVEEAISELRKNGFALEHATLNQFLEEPY
ncbi:hypothetical protein OAP14_10535 [Aliiglaciecola sp.]|nr:hypothetical protein [Aliiglaciecola sp.]